MASLIRGCLHVDTDNLTGSESEQESEFIKLWSQTQYYLTTIHQVEFK